MAKAWTYDDKCYELAKHFLADHPSLDREIIRHIVAHSIQVAAETEIEYQRSNALPAGRKK